MINQTHSGKRWGIDIGGTTTTLGHLLHPRGFRTTAVLDTIPESGPDMLLVRIAEAIHEIDSSPCSAGAGIAGLVDRAEGMLVSSPNLSGWERYPLRDKLSEILKCPVVIDNDCNAFAIQAIDSSSIPGRGLWLIVTLGTGIGGTIVQDGSILYGTGYAGEFGHMTVEASGQQCPCGSTGCWEKYAAAGAVREYYRLYSNEDTDISPKEVALLASRQQPAALRTFENFGKWLGIGLVNLYHCFSPEGVFLAGGLMGASTYFLEHAESEFRRRCKCSWNVNVLPSSTDAGAEGAAIMGRDQAQ